MTDLRRKMTRVVIRSIKAGVGATTLSVNSVVVLQRAGHGCGLGRLQLHKAGEPLDSTRQAAGLGTIEHREARADNKFAASGRPLTLTDVGLS